MLTEKAEGRIAMLIVDKLAFQEKLSEGGKNAGRLYFGAWDGNCQIFHPQSGRK